MVGASGIRIRSSPPPPRRLGVDTAGDCARATPAAASIWAATGAPTPTASIARTKPRRVSRPALERFDDGVGGLARRRAAAEVAGVHARVGQRLRDGGLDPVGGADHARILVLLAEPAAHQGGGQDG